MYGMTLIKKSMFNKCAVVVLWKWWVIPAVVIHNELGSHSAIHKWITSSFYWPSEMHGPSLANIKWIWSGLLNGHLHWHTLSGLNLARLPLQQHHLYSPYISYSAAMIQTLMKINVFLKSHTLLHCESDFYWIRFQQTQIYSMNSDN